MCFVTNLCTFFSKKLVLGNSITIVNFNTKPHTIQIERENH